MTNEEALTQFEESLRKLKIQYDLFFLGVRKLPPSEDRKRLDNLVREIGSSRLRDNASRFRYNTLLGRYNQFIELWSRQMREKEEGPMDFRRRSAAMAEPAEPPPPPPSPPPKTGRVTGAAGDSYVRVTGGETADAARRLHEQITEASRSIGKAPLSIDQIEQVLRSQTEMMKSRYSVDEVGFRVEIVDGKVKLKAKPLTSS